MNIFSFFSVTKAIHKFHSGSKTSLLIIDAQNDFHPGGSLAIANANEDSRRTAELIRSNIDKIDEIYVTLDSHHKTHIAHGAFWKDASGQSPAPFTLIPYEDVVAKKWEPRNPEFAEHCLRYTEFLKQQGKFTLIIWPEHCLIGTTGHAVNGVLNAALHEWAFIRQKEITYVMKGQNCLTEMYSAIKAEYEIGDDIRTQTDPDLMNKLTSGRLLVCGQAKSHCVNFTFCDILNHWPEGHERNLVLLEDATSPVGGFEKQAEEFVNKIKERGCSVIKTTQSF